MRMKQAQNQINLLDKGTKENKTLLIKTWKANSGEMD